MNPKYPVYVISKGRWESRLTSRALEDLNVPYNIVIEPQEYANYAAVIDQKKILSLPFSNLNQGSIPARNWVWEHSISIGASRHWILDDNIRSFMRLYKNFKTRVASGTIFKCIEDFVNRYTNVSIARMNYQWFAKQKQNIPPFYLNTRVYSCILLSNKVSHRWRGKYNEDTDLCLRILKDGNCSLLFNAFLCDKMTTMIMSGGNTDNVYTDGDNRLKFAQSLQEQHPDCVKVVWKWGRWHHYIDYRIFRGNKLKLKEGLEIPNRVNNYGMVLKNIETGEIIS